MTDEVDGPVLDDLARAWAREHGQLEEWLSRIEEAAFQALGGELSEELRGEAAGVAGKLEELLEAFGLEQGARRAAQASRILEGTGPIEADELLRLSEVCESLHSVVEGDPPISSESEADGGVIGLVDLPPDLLVRIEAEALRRGLRPRPFGPGELTGSALVRNRPAALVLYIDGEDGRSSVLMSTGAGAGLDIPTVAIGATPDFDDRLVAVRLGVRRLLSLPVTAREVLDAVEEVRFDAHHDDARVLAVDDDPMFLEMTRSLLASHGVEVETLQDPEAFWETLEATDPDLLLLDVHMPGLDGIELCRLVRSELRWAHLPILFITGATDAETVDALFEAGGDDYIQKPPRPSELLVRVTNRLGRVRFLERLLSRDLLTDLPNRTRFKDELARLISLSEREGTALSVAAVRIDDLEELNDRFGPAPADRILRRIAELLRDRAREGDALGRSGGAEFMIAAFGAGPGELGERMSGLRERLVREPVEVGGSGVPVSLSIGVTGLSASCGSAEVLIREASSASQEARRRGGGIAFSGDGVADLEEIDVLVVENDPALADLLVQALEARRLRVRHIDHGGRALALLVGPEASLRPRAVLLDVGLPGVDGLHVLQRLDEEGLTRTIRVLMLTTRTSEQEVLRSLERGAFDHIPKPFSLPILLHRVDRALEA